MNLLTFLSDPPMNITVSVNPERAVEGSSINLTCSCEANTAADTYTWYRRTLSDSSSTPVQVGSGKMLSLVFMMELHSGLYFCNVRTSFGENNSTEVLLAMPESPHGWCCTFTLQTFTSFRKGLTYCCCCNLNISIQRWFSVYHRQKSPPNLSWNRSLSFCSAAADGAAFVQVSHFLKRRVVVFLIFFNVAQCSSTFS